MFRQSVAAVATAARRVIPALGLTSALVLSAVGPAAPVGVAAPPADDPVIRDHRDPMARLQVVIKRIIIHDDMDVGDGEIAITVLVYTEGEGCPSPDAAKCPSLLVKGGIPEFSAKTGAVPQFDRVFPSYTDVLANPSISPAFGIPIQPDHRYRLAVIGVERDPVEDDDLGHVTTTITDDQGRPRLGTHTERAVSPCEHVPIGTDYCPAGDGNFSVEYEIRPAPLPDLRPVDIKVHDLLGTANKLVCMAVQNIETTDVGPFEVALKVDGVVPSGGRTTAGRLASGTSAELCVEVALPTSGQHTLTAVVDEPRGVIEYNERNNVYEQKYQPVGAAASSTTSPDGTGSNAASTTTAPTGPSPTPAPTPSASLPDLVVASIKVNGQVPDGKDDCNTGKNSVVVVVKNVGEGKARKFVVRLDVEGSSDGDQEKTLDGLDAGQEREVRFEDVRLKKGEQSLSVTADAKNTVTEADETNNTREVAARCADGN